MIMYYYNMNGAALASLAPLEGLGPQVEPSGGWRLFAAVPGDPVLGRGSFKVNHPGQLLAGHGLEVLDAARLPCFDDGPASAMLSGGTAVPLELDGNVRQAIADGRLTGTISQDAPGQGGLGVQAMVDFLDGKTIDPVIYTECIWITADNVADYMG